MYLCGTNIYADNACPSLYNAEQRYLVCGDVGQGVLGSVLHEDAHRRADPDALGVQQAGQAICQVIHLSEGKRGALFDPSTN